MNCRRDDFSFRSGILFLIFGFLFLSEAAYLVTYSILLQEKSRKISRQIAWRQAEIPAIRGTVFAPDGSVLAHSELVCLLHWNTQKAKQKAEVVLERKIKQEEPVSASEILHLKDLLQELPYELYLQSQEQRIFSVGKNLKKTEETYQETLQGRSGLFVVMLDRVGRWVPGTLKIVRKPVPGRAVRLTEEEYRRL